MTVKLKSDYKVRDEDGNKKTFFRDAVLELSSEEEQWLVDSGAAEYTDDEPETRLEPSSEKPLYQMTKSELLEIAIKRNIAGCDRMTKAELLKALEQ